MVKSQQLVTLLSTCVLAFRQEARAEEAVPASPPTPPPPSSPPEASSTLAPLAQLYAFGDAGSNGCSLGQIVDPVMCEAAGNSLGLFGLNELSWSTAPKGCYQSKTYPDKVFFNAHQIGAAQYWATPICQAPPTPGPVAACSTFTANASCPAPRCSWSGSACEQAACAMFTTNASCFAPRCSWSGSACEEAACSTFTTDASCPVPRCLWSGSACKQPCASYTRSETCPSPCAWSGAACQACADVTNELVCISKCTGYVWEDGACKVPYLQTGGGESCPFGYAAITSEADCSTAADTFGKSYQGSASRQNPFGCVGYTNDKRLWWNTNQDGRSIPDNDDIAVCTRLPVCSNVAGGMSSTYPCTCGSTAAASVHCNNTYPHCTASDDIDGTCQAPICSNLSGGMSSTYPCTCRAATTAPVHCNYIYPLCTAIDDIDGICQTAVSMLVNGFCTTTNCNGAFEMQGVTASGTPFYKSDGSRNYIYYDPDCNAGGTTGRWVCDDTAPNTSRSNDLDNDQSCTYRARIDHNQGLPWGTRTWKVQCNGTWTDNYVTMHSILAAPTPAPSTPTTPVAPEIDGALLARMHFVVTVFVAWLAAAVAPR